MTIRCTRGRRCASRRATGASRPAIAGPLSLCAPDALLRKRGSAMITEIAQIDIKPGMEQEFEAGVAKADAGLSPRQGLPRPRAGEVDREAEPLPAVRASGRRSRTTPSISAAARISRNGANASAIASRARRRSSTPSRSTKGSERSRLAARSRYRALDPACDPVFACHAAPRSSRSRLARAILRADRRICDVLRPDSAARLALSASAIEEREAGSCVDRSFDGGGRACHDVQRRRLAAATGDAPCSARSHRCRAIRRMPSSLQRRAEDGRTGRQSLVLPHGSPLRSRKCWYLARQARRLDSRRTRAADDDRDRRAASRRRCGAGRAADRPAP